MNDHNMNQQVKPLRLEIGKTYVDGWGQEHTVKGLAVRHRDAGRPTEYHEDVYWCNTGCWFRGDGRAHTGETAYREPSYYDLQRETK